MFSIKKQELVIINETFKYFPKYWQKSHRFINFSTLFVTSFMYSNHISHFPFCWKDFWFHIRRKNHIYIAASIILYHKVYYLIINLITTGCFIWSNFQITIKTPSIAKKKLFGSPVGKVLPVSIRVHWFTKNELNNSLFSSKSMASLLVSLKGRIQGIILLLRELFIIVH